MTTNNTDEKIKVIAVSIISIGAVILAFKIFNFGTGFFTGIAEKLGLKADETDKNVETAHLKADEKGYFNPAFIRNCPAGTILLTKKNAEIKARNLYDSVGFIYDDPAKMKAVFSNIITKSQVSHLAKVFNDKFHKDLLSWLFLKFDTDTQQQALTEVLSRLDKLPDYFSEKANLKTPKAIPPPLIKKTVTYKGIF